MKTDPVLGKAARFVKSRDFQSASRILESEENRYYGSHKFYYLYAVTCLYSGDFGGALSFFRQARQIKMKDPDTLLGLAALFLHRMDTVQAVDYYLDVQEIDPGNSIAGRALSVIRKHSSHESLADWLAAGKLKKLYPPVPHAALEPKKIVFSLAIAIAALFLVSGILVKFRMLPNPFKSQQSRPAAEFNLSAQERREPVELGGSYRYILTRNQAVDVYDQALSLFTSYRDEKAKINLNRLLESNASEGLKNKSRLLFAYMEIPGFDTFRHSDNIPYSDVKDEPVLYRDVYVIWRGMATNVKLQENTTSFDFLVGYDTRRTLEGIVPVVFDRPVALNTERPLEVLGKIVPLSSENIMLEGTAIHQSGRLETN
ncbi:MAG: tetratricopeptide repeat protein [Treponema sp.]|jgi:tetratricopeptide (TPR) repeat protein|nr:tetratricopeptide repeat protein [Treponema sp.]